MPRGERSRIAISPAVGAGAVRGGWPVSEHAGETGGGEAGQADERHLEVDGVRWVVRPGGRAAAGTGRYGLALIEAVHFYRPGESRPRFEALLAAGQWRQYHDVELAGLLRTAVPVPPAE